MAKRFCSLTVFSQWSLVLSVVSGVSDPRVLCAPWCLSPVGQERTSNHQVVLFILTRNLYLFKFCTYIGTEPREHRKPGDWRPPIAHKTTENTERTLRARAQRNTNGKT